VLAKRSTRLAEEAGRCPEDVCSSGSDGRRSAHIVAAKRHAARLCPTDEGLSRHGSQETTAKVEVEAEATTAVVVQRPLAHATCDGATAPLECFGLLTRVLSFLARQRLGRDARLCRSRRARPLGDNVWLFD